MKTVDEADERVIHRLEAFSDIVIGFSLAQLGLSLGIPKGGAVEVWTHPVPIVAFLITFTIVCRMWWSHHKLFTHFFVPKPLTIFLNFATLGVLLFSIYSVQLFAQIFLHRFDPVALLTYIGSFSVLFVLLGAQYLYGWKVRAAALPAAVAARGLTDGVTLAVIGVVFAAGAGAIAVFGFHPLAFGIFGIALVVLARATRFVVGRLSLYQSSA